MYIVYMDLIHRHYQSKKSKKNDGASICEIKIYQYDNLMHIICDFTFEYLRFGVQTQLTVHHGLTINFKNGDMMTYYQLSNFSNHEKKYSRSKNVRKKNDFKHILYFIQNAIYKGERRKGFWGVKYDRFTEKIFNVLLEKIKPNLTLDYHKNKNYQFKNSVNPFFDMLVDFHLLKKKIKPHDSVYVMIQNHYPKTKWLKLNEHKYLPSILDSYGIKSKYLISEINKRSENDVNIESLVYLCNLFGENYVDYLRKTSWINIINDELPIKKKYHRLKNDSEKVSMVKLINDWEENPSFGESFIKIINEIFLTKEFLESKGLDLKFNITNVSECEILYNKWVNLKNNFKRGFTLEYLFDNDFLNYIEKDIIIDSNVFNVKILKTQEDFFTEGFIMKNCMSKQFNKGVIFIYVVMTHLKKRINVEYKNGNLISCYGKANTTPEKEFSVALDVLTSKMCEYSDITWEKEKRILNTNNFE
jgi:hypothetical protein